MPRLGILLLTLCLIGCTGKKEDTAPTTPATAPAAAAVEVIKFTAIPDQDATELKAKFDPVASYLAEALGVKVEYVPASDYQASVEMFKNGDVHVAWFGGLTGVQARRAVKGARAIVQGAEDPQYYSYFIAHQSTGLERSDDFPAGIASLPFSFGSESSTSGRLMPEFFIHQNSGKYAKEFFENPVNFSGSHPRTAELVAEGTKVKVGALSYKTYEKGVAEGKIDPEVCKVIWKTPFYADYNITAHPALGDELLGKVQQALVGMKEKSLLAAFQRSALIEAKNDDFSGIEKIAEQLGLVR